MKRVLTNKINVLSAQLETIQREMNKLKIEMHAYDDAEKSKGASLSLQDHFFEKQLSGSINVQNFSDTDSDDGSSSNCSRESKEDENNILLFKSVEFSCRPIYILFDLETTGIGQTSNICVTEIGALQITEKGKLIDSFRQLVCPLRNVTKQASNITGLTNNALSSYDFWEKVGKKFYNWCCSKRMHNDSVKVYLIAHNGKRYDSRVLFFENKRHKLQFPQNFFFLDTLSLFREKFTKLPSLALCNVYHHVFDEKIKDAHTAIGDCTAMRELIEILCIGEQNNLFRDWCVRSAESSDNVEKRCTK